MVQAEVTRQKILYTLSVTNKKSIRSRIPVPNILTLIDFYIVIPTVVDIVLALCVVSTAAGVA